MNLTTDTPRIENLKNFLNTPHSTISNTRLVHYFYFERGGD